MKKGFTLVEMLIVVVVIVTLMTMTFRLSSIGDNSSKRNKTIERLNRLENCLSGYYAAFGTYPPVALHGTRNIYARVDGHGIQAEDQENTGIWGWKKIGEEEEIEAWEQVQAACKSQPLGCLFPFPAESEYNVVVQEFCKTVPAAAKGDGSLTRKRKDALSAQFDNGVTDNIGRHKNSETSWQRSQLFQFGLMSFLLPRYLVMMNSDETFFRGNYAQWEQSNSEPCDPFTGAKFGGWHKVRDYSRRTQGSDLARIANIPSQAATARWMPNLQGIVCCNHDYKLFGIKIRGDEEWSPLREGNTSIPVFSPGGYGSTGSQFMLDSATVYDGWRQELFYYSPSPHQTYTLWSGGPNKRTFPPWISRKSLNGDENKRVAMWVEDDIVRMSN